MSKVIQWLFYVPKKPNNCTLEDVRKNAELIFVKHVENVRRIGYDISGQIVNKVLYEYLGLGFEINNIPFLRIPCKYF